MKLNVTHSSSSSLSSPHKPSSSSTSASSINNEKSSSLWSLFARLDPHIVQKLYKEGLQNVNNDDNDDDDDDEEVYKLNSCWHISHNGGSNTSNGIEFLPLAITPISNSSIGPTAAANTEKDPNSTIYVSYNGGCVQSPSTNVQNDTVGVIELYSDLLPSNNSTQVVEVLPLTQVINATSVEVEPLTLSEWELLECHAMYLEHGGLLNQISIVYPNQILFLKVPHRLGFGSSSSSSSSSKDEMSVVRVKVLSKSFLLSNYDLGGQNERKKKDTNEDVIIDTTDLTQWDWENDSDDDDSSSFLSHNNTSTLSSSSSSSSPPLRSSGSLDDKLPENKLIDSKVLEEQIYSQDEKDHLPCLRLVEDTKFLIAPKPRPSSKQEEEEFDPSSPLRVGICPTWDSEKEEEANVNNGFIGNVSTNMLELYHSAVSQEILSKKEYPIIPPGCVALHPDTLIEFVPGWDVLLQKEQGQGEFQEEFQEEKDEDPNLYTKQMPLALLSWFSDTYAVSQEEADGTSSSNDEMKHSNALVRVIAMKCIPKDHIVLHTMLYYQLNITPLYAKVQIQLLTDRQERTSHQVYSFDATVEVQALSFEPNMSKRWPSWFLHNGEDREYSANALDAEKCSFMTEDELMLALKTWSESHGEKLIPIYNGFFMQLIIPNRGEAKRESQGETNVMKATFRLKINHQTGFLNEQTNSDGYVHDTEEDSDELSMFMYMQDLVESLKTNSSRVIIQKEVEKVPFPEHQPFLNHLPQTKSSILGIERAIIQSLDVMSQSSHSGLIVHGEQGSGKTHLALTIAAVLRLRDQKSSIYLDCKNLQSSEPKMSSILYALTTAFHNAFFSAPSVLILDNLDSLTPNMSSSGSTKDDSSLQQMGVSPDLLNQVKLISDHIRFLQDFITDQRSEGDNDLQKVSLLCTCQQLDSIDPMLRSVRRFHSSVKVPFVNAPMRTKLFEYMLTNRAKTINDRSLITNFKGLDHGNSLNNIGRQTEGYRARDIFVLSNRTRHQLYLKLLGRHQKTNLNDTMHDSDISRDAIEILEDQLSKYIPLSLQNMRLSHASTKWEDIAGLSRAKSILMEAMFHPIKFHKIYKHAPIQLPRGVLLFGPSGCGKSYIVPALANACNLNLITCKGPEVLDKYIGASEAKIRQLFQRATAAAPSLLFFDEFEALAPRRGSDSTGVTDRVVNQLLTFLDGVETLSSNNDGSDRNTSVYIIAATSRPDLIDPALLRPGRLERHVYVGYPSNDNERKDIFMTLSKGNIVCKSTMQSIENGELFHLLQAVYSKYKLLSPVDLKSVFDSAHLLAVQEFIGGGKRSVPGQSDFANKSERVSITEDQLKRCLLNVRPSMTKSNYLTLLRHYRPFLGKLDKADEIYLGYDAITENKNLCKLQNLKTTLR